VSEEVAVMSLSEFYDTIDTTNLREGLSAGD
jgi:hypothetical protein